MPQGLPFKVQKLGHAVVNVADLDRSRRFYTEVLGFKVSDVYPASMMPGGMVFLRANRDHHCLALVGGAPATDAQARTLHHLAFELATLDEVFRARDHLKASGARVLGDGEPKIGAHGKPVLFLHPKDFNGTLTELEQV